MWPAGKGLARCAAFTGRRGWRRQRCRRCPWRERYGPLPSWDPVRSSWPGWAERPRSPLPLRDQQPSAKGLFGLGAVGRGPATLSLGAEREEATDRPLPTAGRAFSMERGRGRQRSPSGPFAVRPPPVLALGVGHRPAPEAMRVVCRPREPGRRHRDAAGTGFAAIPPAVKSRGRDPPKAGTHQVRGSGHLRSLFVQLLARTAAYGGRPTQRSHARRGEAAEGRVVPSGRAERPRT